MPQVAVHNPVPTIVCDANVMEKSFVSWALSHADAGNDIRCSHDVFHAGDGGLHLDATFQGMFITTELSLALVRSPLRLAI